MRSRGGWGAIRCLKHIGFHYPIGAQPMSKPPKPLMESRWVKFIPITVAGIGALSLLASAFISNWDKIFPAKHSDPPPAPTASTAGAQSPIISGVGRDVTINMGRSGESQRVTDAHRGAIDGQWVTDVFVNGGYRERLYLRLKAWPDGRVTGMVQSVDTEDGNRIGNEYGIVDGQMEGASVTISYFGGAKSQRDWKPIKESLRLQIDGDQIKGEYQYSDMAPVETVIRRAPVGSPASSR